MKKKMLFISGSLFLLFSLLLFSSLDPAWAAPARTGVINCDLARVRSGPGIENSIVTSLSKGSQVSILLQKNGWCQIKSAEVEGWIASSLMDIQAIKLRVKGEYANLRSGPGTNYDKIGQVNQGEILFFQEATGDWYRIKTQSQLEAYINAPLVEVLANQTQTTVLASKTSTSSTAANKKIAVLLNNRPMQFEVDPVLEKGRTLVPLRAIFEALGATVNWDAPNKTVQSMRGSTKVVLKIGSLHPTVNGKDCPLEVPAKIMNGRTLVPLRFVAEAFGSQVEWDAASQTIHISSAAANNLVACVLESEVNLRETPSAQANKIDTAYKGERLLVMGEKDSWYQVSRNGRTSWVASWLVEVSTGTASDVTSGPGNTTPLPPSQPTETGQTAPGNAINLQRSKDSSGLRIMLVSSDKIEAETVKESGRISFTCKNRQLSGVNVLEEKLGDQKLVAQGTNSGLDAQINISLPSEYSYEILTEDGGRRLVVFVPNAITKMEKMKYGSVGERMVISSTCPLEHTEKLQGNQLEICLKNVQAGQYANEGWSSELVSSMRITAGSGNSKDVYIYIDTKNLGKYSTAVTGDNKDFNLFLFKKSAMQTSNKIVVLDPGHGGSEPGTHGLYLIERDVNLVLGLKVGEILKKNGIQVEYTRCDDTYMDLESRALLANSLNAAVFVSLHHNAVENNTTVKGTECFYYAPMDMPEIYMQREERIKLATLIHDELINTLQRNDRGVKEYTYSVLRNTRVPSALAEIVFLTNPEEEQLAMSDAFEQQAAEAIARGIMNYLNS